MSESAQNNITPEVRIAPPVRETTIPEINTVEEKGKGIFYKLRRVTHTSTVKSGNKDQERPLLALARRADFLKSYRNRDGKKDETAEERSLARESVVDQGKAWDEITEQYLIQDEIGVTLPGLGEQTAKYTRLTPPESRKTPKAEGKPPIFLVPGISNDLDSMGGLLLELPFNGRKVDCVAFPESQMGNITPQFADAVEKAPGFEPHVEFYKQIINKMYPEGQNIELWGFSNGAAVVESILHDSEFQNRVPNAVLVSPAASEDISSLNMNIGVVKDAIRNIANLHKYSLTMSRKTPEPDGQRELKKRVFNNLLKKVSTRMELWKDSRVKEGGKIVVTSGRRDDMTKSYKANESFLENPQVTVVDVKRGTHMTPLLNANNIIEAVSKAQELGAPRKVSI